MRQRASQLTRTWTRLPTCPQIGPIIDTLNHTPCPVHIQVMHDDCAPWMAAWRLKQAFACLMDNSPSLFIMKWSLAQQEVRCEDGSIVYMSVHMAQ